MSPTEPTVSSRRIGQRLTAAPAGDIKRALQAIGLVALVVAYNILVYYVVVLDLAKRVEGQPTFLAFLMFLSVALSVAVILRVGLGEAVDSTKIRNALIKKIGVTPIMTIVACLGALLMSFTPLSNLILPVSRPEVSRPEFMLAKIGITCVTKDENNTPEAIILVTLISADDEQYISKVKDYLNNEAKQDAQDGFPLTWVKHDKSDKFYNALQRYARSDNKGSEMLTRHLRTDNKWLAYVAPLNDPHNATVVLVPTIFDKDHHTSFFAVLTDVADAPTGRLAPSVSATAGSGRAVPLFEVEITPRVLSDRQQTVAFNVEVFTGHICWHVAPSSGI